jgi:dipeptidyl aminopeptidase/acylaminoacyl peptidase
MSILPRLAAPVMFVLTLNAQLPPLIDRELFFGDPEYAGAQISPDGRFISFLKPLTGTRNVWVKKVEEPFSAARPVTNDQKRPISGYFWSRDSKYLLFVQDLAGDENYNVYAVDPAAAPAAGQPVPAARNLTDAKGARALILDVPKSDPDAIFVGLNDRDKAWHDLYKVKLSTGERTLIRRNTDRIAGTVFDLKGAPRIATRVAGNGDTEILRLDGAAAEKIYSCNVFETCAPLRFHKDNARVWLMSNKGDADLIALHLLDPKTGATEFVESDPLKRVDLSNPIFSDLTDELLGTSYLDDRLRIYWKDASYKADYEWLQKRFPGMELGLGSATRDETRYVISARSDTEPGETLLFTRKGRRLEPLYRVRERIPRESLAPMQAVRYKSSDGLEIPGYLTLPKGVPAKALPAIVVPHGGPWSRDGWGYDSIAQFLANRGYAVLQPNFRGSTGFGKKFLNAGNREWGRKMQDDITWGVKHLVDTGVADPKRVGIMGGSYGGYATLAGVAFTPGLFAAGVSIVGPSNLITLLESIPPYWESVRRIFDERMGDPNTPEGKKLLAERSPLNSAGQIRSPLLVIQGANDPRVSQAESDQIVIALRDRKFPVEYLVAPDEGHGFARPVNSLAMFTAAEKFLARHLGGRAQQEASAEVAKRLAEITVDPATVKLAAKASPTAAGEPKPVAALAEGVYKYKASIQAGGQNIALALTTTVKRDGGEWSVSDRMQAPMGEVTAAAVLEAAALSTRKISIRQGPVEIDVAFADGKATGVMKAGGEPKPIAVDLGGPVFADAAGVPQIIATLPLGPGYSVQYRNFDLQKQRAKRILLVVAGDEKVTVPAGAFDAWKIETTDAEGGPGKTTIWIDKATRKAVKLSSAMPQMGGAVLTAELEP